MGKSERDPLFFPPSRYTDDLLGEEQGPPEVDPAAQTRILGWLLLLAMAGLAALFAASHWEKLTGAEKAPSGVFDEAYLHTLGGQEQAEYLLEWAVQGSQRASGLMPVFAPRWIGSIHPTPRLREIENQALLASDYGVRRAAMETDLAASGLEKTPESVARLIEEAEPGGSNRRWALWSLGLLGGLGVDAPRAREALLSYAHAPEEEIRYWAVGAMPFLGDQEVVEPLLAVLGHDPSSRVREQAAEAIAAGGLITRRQRMAALPHLLGMLQAPETEEGTRRILFQALERLTGEKLPRESAAWQRWWAAQKLEPGGRNAP